MSERFIDRENEFRLLEEQYSSKDASFVVVYGRRRVGKTALVSEFMQRKGGGLYYLATEESAEQNLKAFRKQTADFIGNELLASSNADWLTVFRYLSEYDPSQRIIIAIDEFQYIGRSDAAFPSVMQKAWDTILKKANVMLIICGSIVASMRSQVLDYDSPLYGRRTAQIRLKQIGFDYYPDFFKGRSRDELVPFYAVTGGVPRYIDSFCETEDLFDGIRKNILTPGSYLYEEPNFLLRNEVSEIGSYFSLLRAIAMENHKMSEISGFLGTKQTSLTKYLKTLIDLDILERTVPVTEPDPEKSKSGLYYIKDYFLAFWFRYVYPYQSYLESGQTNYVIERIKNSFSQNYVSFVYEELCRQKMWNLAAEGTWDYEITKIGRYWGSAAGETDIVAFAPGGIGLVLGECKYTESPEGLQTLHDLQNKADDIKRLTGTEKASYIIFSAGGFTKGLKDEAGRNKTITLIEHL